MMKCTMCNGRGFIAYMVLVNIIGDNKYYQCNTCKTTKITKED